MELINQEKTKGHEKSFDVMAEFHQNGFQQTHFQENARSIRQELNWLKQLIHLRLQELYQMEEEEEVSYVPFEELVEIPEQTTGVYSQFISDNQLDVADRLLLILCFAAQHSPQLLDVFLQKNPDKQAINREVGGVFSRENGQFVPTLQTALFLLGGTNEAEVARFYHHFQANHFLFREQIVVLENLSQNFAFLANFIIKLESSYFDYFLIGKKPRLDNASNFPATLLETDKTFDDLILPDTTMQQLDSIMNFIRFRKELFDKEGVKGKIKPGFTALLYGMPGTGKTLTVSVMGKHLGVDVYSVNLSRVVSKYIGETEKNLEKIFERLEGKDCILFFDEADALFGKRTEVKDAKDRYANQEVAYLLQRIEKCSNPVILASNYRQNLDDAFKRRILAFIHVPPPEYHERLKMWTHGVPEAFAFEPANLAEKLSLDFPLTGANIANVIKLGCIQAMAEGTNLLTNERLEPFIQQELRKEHAHVKPPSPSSRSMVNKINYTRRPPGGAK